MARSYERAALVSTWAMEADISTIDDEVSVTKLVR